VIAEMLRRTSAILDAAVQSAPTTSISHAPLADASAAGPAAIPAPAPPASASGAPVTDAWVRGRELQMLGINYEWSALAVDDSRARPAVAAAAARAYLPDIRENLPSDAGYGKLTCKGIPVTWSLYSWQDNWHIVLSSVP
jgi:hypothetical protein